MTLYIVKVVTPGGEIAVNIYDLDASRKTLEAAGLNQETIDAILRQQVDITQDTLRGLKTSDDAEIFDENHIGYKWAEIDWPHADEGYIRVKINEQTTSFTECDVRWYEDEVTDLSPSHNKIAQYVILLGKWVNIPLTGNATEHAVSISQGWHDDELEALQEVQQDKAKTEAELEKVNSVFRDTLTARFDGSPIN